MEVVLGIYIPIHFLCAVLAYGTIYHMATTLRAKDGWKKIDFGAVGTIAKFATGILAIVAGPIALIIWFAFAWAHGIPPGLQFVKKSE